MKMIRLGSLTIGLVAVAIANHVVELTSENFEALTQISTGATTGDWLIRFYATSCDSCEKMDQAWESLAQRQQDVKTSGDIGAPVANIGDVNCDEHQDVCKRFDVTAFPTILLFKKGIMFVYMGPRSAADFEKFIVDDYNTAPSKVAPKPLSVISQRLDALRMTVQNLIRSHAFTSTYVQLIILGLVVIIVVFLLTNRSQSHSVQQAKKAN